MSSGSLPARRRLTIRSFNKVGRKVNGAIMSKNGNGTTLPKTVKVTAGSILYLPISADPKAAADMTAVFSPNGYKAGNEANIILYFHGNHKGDDPNYPKAMTIEQYLTKAPFAALLDSIANANPFKNVLFVAPSLAPFPVADIPLVKGIDKYLDDVLQGSQQSGVHQGQTAPPKLKNLVLACHSGGGRVMLGLAQSMFANKSPAFGTLRECWGFDCLYDDFPVIDIESINATTKAKWTLNDFAPSGCEQEWRKAARNKSSNRIFMHWFERKTRNKNLDKLVKWSPQASNLKVDPPFYTVATDPTNDPALVTPAPRSRSTDHNNVPKDNFADRLQALTLS